jgi:putative ABC transport system substrate-binding protein
MTTTRRAFLAGAIALSAAPLAAEAQQAGKVYRIGWLGGRPFPDAQPFTDAFRQALHERGWVEGQNFVFEHRPAVRSGSLPDLAAELIRLKIDVIVAVGDPAIRAAKQATSTIPIVMAPSADPIGAGFVASLARPGGNITGSSILAAELGGKRLELLREVVPKASRVAVLWNSADPAKALELKDTQVAARALGVTLQSVEVRGADDFDSAFSAISRGRPDALIAFSEPLALAHRGRIVDFAAKSQLPMISEIKEFADAGGLMTYGPSLPDLFRRAATYVDKILKGAKPADLPIEQPTKFELVINLKTAKALGLTIPRSVLLRADQVIE